MIKMSLELPVNATPQNIWRVYREFSLRKQWETDLEALELDGPFTAGVGGTFLLTGMPPIRFVLTEVQPHRCFRDVVDLAGVGQLEFGHEIFEGDGQCFVRHSISFLLKSDEITGERYAFFQKVTKDLTDVLWRLKIVAESL
ncbi:SRPBCC family protein [Desulfovibrio desulfuricans]|uniref:SRPBCC family protein n=1 Tax=Desulfovibrio desulfuricans TaxID=876 RepID=UPI0035B2116E